MSVSGKAFLTAMVCGFVCLTTEASAAPASKLATGQGSGGSTLRTWTIASGSATQFGSDLQLFSTPSGGTFLGGVTVAATDGPSGGTWLAVGKGPGSAPQVRVIRLDASGTPSEIARFFAYGSDFRGGVSVATYTDGTNQFVVTGKGEGGAPKVNLFNIDSGNNVSLVASFFPYPSTFRGGVFVAAGDVNGDGVADIIVAKGPGGGPRVRVFDGSSPDLYHPLELANFLAYESTNRRGVYLAAGDLDGDGADEIITGAGAGGGPHVRVFKSAAGAAGGVTPFGDFFAYDSAFSGGVEVGTVVADGVVNLVTAPGPGVGPEVRVFRYAAGNFVQAASFFAFDEAYNGGVSLGGIAPALRVGPLIDRNHDGQLTFVCFGDSITQGYGDNDGEPAKSPPGGYGGYPLRLQQAFPSLSVVNAGVGGEPTNNGVQRLPSVISAWRPDYVLVSEGANDLRTSQEDAVVSNVGKMLNIVLQSGARPLFGTVTPTCGPPEGCSNSYSHPSTIGDTNRRLVDIAHNLGLTVVDFHGGFTSDPFGPAIPSSGLIHVPEGLHPNANGYDVMADIAAHIMRTVSP